MSTRHLTVTLWGVCMARLPGSSTLPPPPAQSVVGSKSLCSDLEDVELLFSKLADLHAEDRNSILTVWDFGGAVHAHVISHEDVQVQTHYTWIYTCMSDTFLLSHIHQRLNWPVSVKVLGAHKRFLEDAWVLDTPRDVLTLSTWSVTPTVCNRCNQISISSTNLKTHKMCI